MEEEKRKRRWQHKRQIYKLQYVFAVANVKLKSNLFELANHPDPFSSKANIRVQGPCSRGSNRTESLSYDSNEEHQSF